MKQKLFWIVITLAIVIGVGVSLWWNIATSPKRSKAASGDEDKYFPCEDTIKDKCTNGRCDAGELCTFMDADQEHSTAYCACKTPTTVDEGKKVHNVCIGNTCYGVPAQDNNRNECWHGIDCWIFNLFPPRFKADPYP